MTRKGLKWGLRATSAAPVSVDWPDDALMQGLGILAPMLAWSPKSFHVGNMAATAAGLPIRPLADTLRDTLAWWQDQPEERRVSPRSRRREPLPG